jgi:hypothetical protein
MPGEKLTKQGVRDLGSSPRRDRREVPPVQSVGYICYHTKFVDIGDRAVCQACGEDSEDIQY